MRRMIFQVNPQPLLCLRWPLSGFRVSGHFSLYLYSTGSVQLLKCYRFLPSPLPPTPPTPSVVCPATSFRPDVFLPLFHSSFIFFFLFFYLCIHSRGLPVFEEWQRWNYIEVGVEKISDSVENLKSKGFFLFNAPGRGIALACHLPAMRLILRKE